MALSCLTDKTDSFEACVEEECVCSSDHFIKALSDLEDRLELTNKQRRYQAYREAARLLQYAVREKLPPCVEENVKIMFPDFTYVGYCEAREPKV